MDLDLASNKACIADRDEFADDSFIGEQYDTALTATETIWADSSLLWWTWIDS